MVQNRIFLKVFQQLYFSETNDVLNIFFYLYLFQDEELRAECSNGI